MRRLGLSLLVALVGGLSVAARPANAQYQLTRRTIVPRDSAQANLLRVVREDLTQLRLAQDAYFAQRQTYAVELADLPGYHPKSGATIVLTEVSRGGWQAMATDPRLPGAEVVTIVRDKGPAAAGGQASGARAATPS